ncbi:uncharacterized protein ACBR49_016412 [Aulostomus maculatus]
MGNSCCRAESPCDSAEERSGLLKDDSKNMVPVGETAVVGTCGPEADDDMRKTADEANLKVEEKAEADQVKQNHESGELERNNAQENGSLRKESRRISSRSPGKASELQDNSSREMKETPAEAEILQCTFPSLCKENPPAEWEDFPVTNATEENLSSVQDRISDGISQAAEAENPSHANAENTSPNDDVDNEEKITSESTLADTVAEQPQNSDVSSVPNPELSGAAGQVASVAGLHQEISVESSCGATEDSGSRSPSVSKEADPEDKKSPECPGAESAGRDHSGEEGDRVRELVNTAGAATHQRPLSNQDEKADPVCPDVVTALEDIRQDVVEEITLDMQSTVGDLPGEENFVMEEAENVPTKAEKDVEVQEAAGKDPQVAEIPPSDVQAEDVSASERADSAEEGLGNSEEDLYRGAEELSASHNNEPGPPPALESTIPTADERCSLAPAVNILSYSEREWRGNTAKSALIRKGYKEMSQRFGGVRRVRGDNYCALRATLFQVLSHSTRLPAWLQEDDVAELLEELEGLISQWRFPGECFQGDGTRDVAQQLKGYVELLQNKWQAAVDCSSAAERQQLCESVFQGGEEELGLLEALKLLMLARAVELHDCMQAGGNIPLFCWLLFARDSSDCPRSFLSNHLRHVGLSAGLEQVEMFLLGYALQCTIQVYRLYKADTEEFVTYYPDDHKDDWPCVCLVTEDDRHYNVPVDEAAEAPAELPSS